MRVYPMCLKNKEENNEIPMGFPLERGFAVTNFFLRATSFQNPKRFEAILPAWKVTTILQKSSPL